MHTPFPRYSSLLHPISSPKPRLPRDAATAPAWWGVPMVYLVALGLSEVVAGVSGVQLGMISQTFLLFLLVVHGLATRDSGMRALLHSLVVVPLTSLLALALPMAGLRGPLATLVTAAIVIMAVAVAVSPLRLGAKSLRLRFDVSDLPLAGLAIPLGVVLGSVEYLLLKPESGPGLAVAPVVALAIVVALQQEIAFRGFVLAAAERLFGAGAAVVYAAILFALPQLGAVPSPAVPLAFAVGALFGAMTLWARSLTPAIFASVSLSLSLTLLAPALLNH